MLGFELDILRALDRKIAQILYQLQPLDKLEQIMASQADLKAMLDNIVTQLSAVQAKEDAQAAQIKALQDQIGAGVPVTQEQLDGLFTESSQISDALKPLAALDTNIK